MRDLLKIILETQLHYVHRAQLLCVRKATGFIRSIVLLISAAGLYGLAGNVHAAAGDVISNTATVDYFFQAVPFTVESSPTGNAVAGIGNGVATTFTEDRLVNFNVVSNDATTVVVNSGQVSAVLTFTVTNVGGAPGMGSNGPLDFLLTAVNTSPNPFGGLADTFDPNAPMRVFVEDGTTPGTYQPAEDTAVFIDELAPNNSRTVYVVVDIPATVVATEISAVALVAQVVEGGAAGQGAVINSDDNGHVSPAGIYSNGATNVAAGVVNNVADTAGLETIFNDPAGIQPEDADSTGAVTDIAANGQHSDVGAFEVSGSPVTINKSVTVIDTFGGTDPHVGATLRYQLDVIIVGAGGVNNLVITDPVPANTTYTPGSISLSGPTPLNPVFASFNGGLNQIEVDLSEGMTRTITVADSPVTITFDVTIN